MAQNCSMSQCIELSLWLFLGASFSSSSDLSVRFQKSSVILAGGKYFIAGLDCRVKQSSPMVLLDFCVAASAWVKLVVWEHPAAASV